MWKPHYQFKICKYCHSVASNDRMANPDPYNYIGVNIKFITIIKTYHYKIVTHIDQSIITLIDSILLKHTFSFDKIIFTVNNNIINDYNTSIGELVNTYEQKNFVISRK
jgi:hypothetical protein